MSNEEQKTITINLYLIGDEGVGKKSFVSRLNTMACSFSHPNKNKIKPPKEEKKKKDEDEEENPDEPRKKKEPFHMPPPSSNQLEYKLGSTILTIQAFIIDGAIQCRIDEDVSSDDEDEEIVHEYHIKFTWTKKTILNYLRMFAENTNEKNTNEDIFVFMYDLSDFTTFERMMLYYESVNRRFKLHENKAKCVIIGNKSEKKMLFNKEDLEKMDSFYNINESFQKFEISNKLHFNFSKFLLEFIETMIDEPYDKDKLSKILINKFTFNKAKRVGMQIESDTPGPDQYNTNIYEFDTMEQRNEIITNMRKRFINKIFVNKIGPLFYSNKKDEERKLRNSEFEGAKRRTATHIQSKIENNFTNGNIGKGATFGEVPCRYNLKSERTKRIEERNKEYMDSFGENILTSIGLNYTNKKDPNYLEDCHNRKYQYQQNKLEERKNKLEKYLELRDKNYEKINKDIIAKSQAYKDKYVEYDEKKSKQRYLDLVYGNNAKILENLYSHNEINAKLKKEAEEKNLPKMYDVRGNMFNPKKGPFITGKRQYKDKETHNAPYMTLKSDFDIITQHAKDSSIGYSPRYRDNILKTLKEVPEKQKFFDETKFDRFKENRKKSERNANINQFVTDTKLRQERHNDLMKEINEDAKKYHEQLLQKYYSKNPQDMEKPPEINYSLVEDKAPSYTLKGRHEKKVKPETTETKGSYFEGKKIPVDYDNLENPDIAAVRWKIPSYSFGKDERWDIDKYKQKILENKTLKITDNVQEKEEKFDNSLADRVDYSNLGMYDSKSNRAGMALDYVKGYPGPGYYKIKGFAEEIVEKYEKINNMKKLNELGKEKKEEKKDNIKEKTVTGASVNEYMEEFQKDKNEIPSREKSEIGEKIGEIRGDDKPIQTTDYGTNQQTESKVENEEKKQEINEENINSNIEKIEENKQETQNENIESNNEQIEQSNKENENETKPENEVKINEEERNGNEKVENVENNEQQENQTKPEDVVKINNDTNENVINENNEQQENKTKPDDPVKINNDNNEQQVESHVEPEENQTKPNDPVKINEGDHDEEIGFEEPAEEP